MFSLRWIFFSTLWKIVFYYFFMSIYFECIWHLFIYFIPVFLQLDNAELLINKVYGSGDGGETFAEFQVDVEII